jgi:hypothetical protein
MTGIKGFNREMFREAAECLRNEYGPKNEVISPNELDAGDDSVKTWVDYMRRDLRVLPDIDVAYALPGWEHSRGARLEATVFRELGIPVRQLVYENGQFTASIDVHPENLPAPRFTKAQ